MTLRPRDFKSLASTSFAIRAWVGSDAWYGDMPVTATLADCPRMTPSAYTNACG
jgi:hypothetical protein